MDTTLNQICDEIRLFQLSDEYRSIIKEGYELDLLNRYIESQEYIVENEIHNPEYYGLYLESDNKNNAAKSKQPGKIRQFFSKIWQGFLNILKKVGKFFKHLFNFWRNGEDVEEQNKHIEEINKELKECRRDLDKTKVYAAQLEVRLSNNEAVEKATQELLKTTKNLFFNTRDKMNKYISDAMHYKKQYKDLYDNLSQYNKSVAENILLSLCFTQDKVKFKSVNMKKFMDVYENFKEGDNIAYTLQCAGHIETSGFDYYNPMIEKAIKEMKRIIGEDKSTSNLEEETEISAKKIDYMYKYIESNLKDFKDDISSRDTAFKYQTDNFSRNPKDPEIQKLDKENTAKRAELHKLILDYFKIYTAVSQNALSELQELKNKRDAAFKYIDLLIPIVDGELKKLLTKEYDRSKDYEDSLSDHDMQNVSLLNQMI